VFDAWPGSFPQWQVLTPDLHADLDLSTASMNDYANVAVMAAAPPVPDALVALYGWSMGGLVALMAAPIVRPDALVLLEPSLPAELAGQDPHVPVNAGTFEPAELSLDAGQMIRQHDLSPALHWVSGSEAFPFLRFIAPSSLSPAKPMVSKGERRWPSSTGANLPTSRIYTTSRSSGKSRSGQPFRIGYRESGKRAPDLSDFYLRATRTRRHTNSISAVYPHRSCSGLTEPLAVRPRG
jgi:pimeloyl-ACP methyl ester carboxylesterase